MNYKDIPTHELLKLLNTYTGVNNPFEAIKILEQCENFAYFYSRIVSKPIELREWYWAYSLNKHNEVKEFIICDTDICRMYVYVYSIERITKIEDNYFIFSSNASLTKKVNYKSFLNQFNTLYIENQFYLYNISTNAIKQEMLQNKEFSNYVKVNSL